MLVAVAIPIFTSQLEKAREATDIANMRSAKAAAVTAYLGEEKIGSTQLGSTQAAAATLYFDAQAGKLLDSAPSVKYGKGTATTGDANNTDFGYDPAKAAADYVTVTVAVDGSVTMSFNKAS